MSSLVLPSIRPFGFVFDIDGTLIRGSTPLPHATSTLLQLQRDNIPFVLLTNAGGETEASKALTISNILNVPIAPSQLIQGHTPFAALVDGPEQLRQQPVLVIGGGPDGESPRTIAEDYGFQCVITPGDILAAYPKIWPFPHNYSSAHARPLPQDCKIAAIMMFSNPLDWGPVLQIVIDLLLSQNGQLGTRSAKNGDSTLPNSGYLLDGQPMIYFSGSDLCWTSEYPVPRFGFGSFRAALEGTWRAYTGENIEFNTVELGKPSHITFAFAETALENWRREMHGLQKDQDLLPLKEVFMVGDSPTTDICGANGYLSTRGTTWSSILVKTGVWDGKSHVMYSPTMEAEGVKEALEYALEAHEK